MNYHLSEISCKPVKRQKSEKASEDKLKTTEKNNSIRTFRYQTQPDETSGESLPDFIRPVKTSSREDLCPNNLSLTVKIKDESTKLMRNPTTILLEQAQKDKVSHSVKNVQKWSHFRKNHHLRSDNFE